MSVRRIAPNLLFSAEYVEPVKSRPTESEPSEEMVIPVRGNLAESSPVNGGTPAAPDPLPDAPPGKQIATTLVNIGQQPQPITLMLDGSSESHFKPIELKLPAPAEISATDIQVRREVLLFLFSYFRIAIGERLNGNVSMVGLPLKGKSDQCQISPAASPKI